MRPEQIAADVLHCDVSDLRGERIKGGLTNESWRVQGGGHDVVVRISTADEHALQLDRKSEALVLTRVEQAGIGAQVLLCAPQSRLLVTRNLPGRTWQEHEACEPVNVARLARLLRRLHALSVPPGVQTIDLAAALHGYWTELDRHSRPADRELLQQRDRALEIAQISAANAPACLCHNDVHHLNVIDNGERLWLLDWEYAGVGDRFFDLASVCAYQRYDAARRYSLLSEYLGEASESSLSRLDQMIWLFDYIKELWLTVRLDPQVFPLSRPGRGAVERDARARSTQKDS